MMTAVLIPTASEAEWLEARRAGITASEIATVMGLSPWDSPYALYHRKLGVLPDVEQNDAMELGAYLEEFIAGKYQRDNPDYNVIGDGRTLYAHRERRWQLATPDRRLYECAYVDDDGNAQFPDLVAILECKVDGGSDEWGDPGTDEIPVHYRAQVLWQCDVMGVDSWFIACLDWNRRKVRVYEGVIDAAAEADLKLMRDEARDFLDRIDYCMTPDVDWRPATIAALKTMHPGVEDREVYVRRSLAIQYAAAVRRYKAAERRKDEMTARILAAVGDGRKAIDERTGDVVATRSVSQPKRIDTERLRAEQPAIAAEYTKPPKPEVKLTPAKPPKDAK